MPLQKKLPRRKLARVLVRPPTRLSHGATVIRNVLAEYGKLSRRDPIPKQYRHVINWGNPIDFTRAEGVNVYNPPNAVRNAIDKIVALQMLKEAGVPTPEFSTAPPVERGKNAIWLARSTVSGSSGAGITIVREGDAFPAVPLYVKYIRKLEEIRVHVFQDRAILCQYKKRVADQEQTADQKLIRNYKNGWVFCPRDVETLSNDITTAAINAVKVLGLDFGAVDMVIGKTDNLPYVLEVNTAPGLDSPSSIKAWGDAFKEKLNL